MSTLVHTPTARPPLRLLERRPHPAPAAPMPAGPAAGRLLLERLEHWLATLPEPRNRLGATTRV